MQQEKFKILDFIRELTKRIDKELDNFPKREIEIKLKLRNECYELLELAYESNITVDKNRKQANIEKCLAKIKVMDFLLNYSYEKELITSKKYLKLAERMNDIVKYFNGWLKKLRELK